MFGNLKNRFYKELVDEIYNWSALVCSPYCEIKRLNSSPEGVFTSVEKLAKLLIKVVKRMFWVVTAN